MNWRLMWVVCVVSILSNGILAISGINVALSGCMVFGSLIASIVCAAFMCGDYDE